VIIFINPTPPLIRSTLEPGAKTGDRALSNGYARVAGGMKINVLQGKSHGVFFACALYRCARFDAASLQCIKGKAVLQVCDANPCSACKEVASALRRESAGAHTVQSALAGRLRKVFTQLCLPHPARFVMLRTVGGCIEL
jgi:hypothetical protein